MTTPGGATDVTASDWINWAQRVAAIAQNGLTFTRDPYDRERYEQLRSIAAEIMSRGSGHTLDTIRQLLVAESGYATPKVDLRAAIFRGRDVLLVREAESGLWSLPGGWADACESAAEGVTREVREETGYEVKGLVLAAVYDRAKHAHHPPFAFHVYKLFFVGSIGNDANAGVQDPGIVEHAFFDLAAMPPLCRSRVLLSQIERCYAHLQDASLPTYVD